MTTSSSTIANQAGIPERGSREQALAGNTYGTAAARMFGKAGLAAIAAGSLFIFIQTIHPPDVLASVGTARWTIVHILGFAMSIFALFGVAGIQARQADRAGWLGIAGSLVLGSLWSMMAAFQFAEAFLYPVLAVEAPAVAEALLGMFGGHATGMDLGAYAAVKSLADVTYLMGGLLFGIATLRAAVLPRRAGGLLAFGTILPLFTAWFLPHPYDRILAVPVGLAMIWLGYALWSTRHGASAD